MRGALWLISVAGLLAGARGIKRSLRPSAAPPRISAPNISPVGPNGAPLPPLNKVFLFDQLKDHNDPSKGTFQQRYFFTAMNYVAGGPIVLFTPGETAFDDFDGYLTNLTIPGRITQQNGGAGVILEHRFFGQSNPGPDLSSTSLSLLNIDQAVNDLVYFAENVVLPMPGGDAVAPGKAPWLLVGGSYSGALTAWTMTAKPGVFWAGWASSAVVEAIDYFWGYFEPIRQTMAKNCSADVEAVISHVDSVIASGNAPAIQTLKENWGLGNLTHLDDFAGSLRSNLFDWQGLQPISPQSSIFYQFCDALEVKNGVAAGPEGWGLENALQAWGKFWTDGYLNDICDGFDVVDCLGTYDPTQTFFTDDTIPNDERSWEWIVCNEVGFFQDGAPPGWPTLVSRLIAPVYDERQCTYFFPDHFKNITAPNAARTNAVYKGFQTNVDRLFIANGKRDPWREATMSTDFARTRSTASQPIAVSDGFHTSDLLTENAVDSTVNDVQTLGLSFIAQWLGEWHATVPAAPPGTPGHLPPPASLPHPTLQPLAIPSSVQASPPSALASPPPSSGSTMTNKDAFHASFNPMIRVPPS